MSVGLIEALTDAIGSSDNEIGGINATRLTVAGAIGDTTINVETTLDWPDIGSVAIDGVVYFYTSKTLTTLVGITYLVEGDVISGLKQPHLIVAPVLDLSRTRSAVDQVRRAMLTEYAEGDDLNVVGRNLGVTRPPILGVSDDLYRAVIQAVAYNPRGTMYGLELALNTLVGADNYTLYEDLVSRKHTVYVSLKGAALATARSQGRTFLTGPTYRPAATDSTVTLLKDALAIRGVRWKDEGGSTDTRTARPSAVTLVEYPGQTPAVEWTYVGGAAEASSVVITASDGGAIDIDAVGATQAYYRRYARVQPESSAEFAANMTIPTGTTIGSDTRQFVLDIWDGARILRVGVSDSGAGAGEFSVGFADNSGALLAGAATILTMGTYYEIGLRKRGVYVDLIVNGNVKQSALTSAFVADSSTPRFNFGGYTTASNAVVGRVRSVRYWAKTYTDYWTKRASNGAVATATPTKFGGSAIFDSGSVGKQIVISGSAISNAHGGTNNGRFFVASIVDSSHVILIGAQKKHLTTNVANPTRIVTAEYGFNFPDDLGKKVIITGSTLGNDGTYVIGSLRDDRTFADLESFNTRIAVKTNVAHLVGAAFQTETDLLWQMQPVFETEASLVWEFSNAGSKSGLTLSLPDNLPFSQGGYERVLEIFQTEVYSAQILEDVTIANVITAGVGSRYPFYLADSIGVVRTFLDDLTAAGVFAEYRLF